MSQLNWNRQLGLAAGLFALGTLAYWLEFKHRPEKEAIEEQSKKIFSLKDVSTQTLTLSIPGKHYGFSCLDLSAKLCKPGDNSKWEMTAPQKLKADDSNVNAFLSTLNNLTSNEVIDLKTETPEKRASLLKEYGLDAQARKNAKWVYQSAESGGTVLYLGQVHPIGQSVFALKEQVAAGQKMTGNADENTVYLISTTFTSNLDHELTYWRDKKLLTLTSHEIASFKLDSKTPLTGFKKEGQWFIQTGKEEVPGDTENIESFLSSATYLNAKDFTSDNKNDPKAKAALRGFAPALSLTLQKEKREEKGNTSPITLTFFQQGKSTQPSGKLYATVSNLDPLFEMEPGTKNQLDKSLKDLRLTKLITSMERFGAKRIEFSGTPIGTSPLMLVQKDGKWVNSADPNQDVHEKVQGLLEKLSGNRIKEFVRGAAIPQGEQQGLKLTLGDDKTEQKREFLFWKKSDQLYVRDLQNKLKEAYWVDSTLLNVLPWTNDFFKKPAAPTDSKSEPVKK